MRHMNRGGRQSIVLSARTRGQIMKRIVLVLTILLAITSFGCSGSTPEDLFDTAKLEELQDNHEHARELYQQIIEKYPESEYAKQSKERLTKMKLN